jgi:hypothetical protein
VTGWLKTLGVLPRPRTTADLRTVAQRRHLEDLDEIARLLGGRRPRLGFRCRRRGRRMEQFRADLTRPSNPARAR